MDLRVSVQISDSLDVHHDQLVARSLKSKVTEGLMDTKEMKIIKLFIQFNYL